MIVKRTLWSLNSSQLDSSFLSFPFLSFPLLSSPLLSSPFLSFPFHSFPFLSFPERLVRTRRFWNPPRRSWKSGKVSRDFIRCCWRWWPITPSISTSAGLPRSASKMASIDIGVKQPPTPFPTRKKPSCVRDSYTRSTNRFSRCVLAIYIFQFTTVISSFGNLHGLCVTLC